VGEENWRCGWEKRTGGKDGEDEIIGWLTVEDSLGGGPERVYGPHRTKP
jgi:hypothetical protein